MQRTGTREDKKRGTKDFPIAFYHVDSMHPRYQMTFHWHLEFEIVIIHSGHFELHIEERSFSLGEGDIVFIDSGLIHGGIPYDAVYDCIVFNPELIRHRNYLDDVFVRDVLHHRIHLIPCIRASEYDKNAVLWIALSLLAKAFSHPGQEGNALIVTAALKLFFSYYELQGFYSRDEFARSRGWRGVEQMKAVIEYIDDNFSKQLTLDELSHVAGLSTRYFCSFFKEFTGRTCFDYINSVKMENAAIMLSDRDRSITEISYAAGFEDASYFSRLFKKYMNQSPREYRKRMEESEISMQAEQMV